MAENKKSFVLYADLIHTIKKLPDDKAGLLFKHILSYVNDENPVTDDLIVDISFEPIKQQLKRDLVKYAKTAERSRENGKLGGRPKNPKKPKETQQVISKPKKPDSVNVNVNDSVNVNDINKIPMYDDFKKYALSKKSDLNQDVLKLKYEAWKEAGWKNGNGKKIINWKSSLLNTIPYIKEKSSDKKENKNYIKDDDNDFR